jgi:translation initiation factor IF-3
VLNYKINEQISEKSFLLIDANKNKVGETQLQDAIRLAEESGLDLVMVSENPIVCKIMDFKKFLYEMKKKQKKQHKMNKVETTKEIRISLLISSNDLNTKKRKIKKLLNEGHKVQVFALFTNNRQTFQHENAYQMLSSIYEEIKGICPTSDLIRTSIKSLFITISPN